MKQRLSAALTFLVLPPAVFGVLSAGCDAEDRKLSPIEQSAEKAGNPTVTNAYLFSFFAAEKYGLRLAYSYELYNWTEIPGPHLVPKLADKIMRDPFISLGPDGTFHLVWTTGWGRRDIGYARSRDLTNWSPQRLLGVMASKQKTKNCWAPKLFYDDAEKHWMILWSSWVDDGTFGPPELPNTSKQHRIFYATTKDFKQISQPKLLFDPGYSCIDAYLLKDKSEYLLFFKDERDNDSEVFNGEHQNIRIARGKSPIGPFGDISETITGMSGKTWQNEGPSAIKVANEYFVFYDHYKPPPPRYYGAVKSTDLLKWIDVSDKMSFPEGAKHGSIIRLPKQTLTKFLKPLPN